MGGCFAEYAWFTRISAYIFKLLFETLNCVNSHHNVLTYCRNELSNRPDYVVKNYVTVTSGFIYCIAAFGCNENKEERKLATTM